MEANFQIGQLVINDESVVSLSDNRITIPAKAISTIEATAEAPRGTILVVDTYRECTFEASKFRPLAGLNLTLGDLYVLTDDGKFMMRRDNFGSVLLFENEQNAQDFNLTMHSGTYEVTSVHELREIAQLWIKDQLGR